MIDQWTRRKVYSVIARQDTNTAMCVDIQCHFKFPPINHSKFDYFGVIKLEHNIFASTKQKCLWFIFQLFCTTASRPFPRTSSLPCPVRRSASTSESLTSSAKSQVTFHRFHKTYLYKVVFLRSRQRRDPFVPEGASPQEGLPGCAEPH